MLVKDTKFVEKCTKGLIEEHRFKNKEIYKVNIDKIKNAIFDCALLRLNYIQYKNRKDMDVFVVFDNEKIVFDTKIDDIEQTKKQSRKQSKRHSKKHSKTHSRKQSKK